MELDIRVDNLYCIVCDMDGNIYYQQAASVYSSAACFRNYAEIYRLRL